MSDTPLTPPPVDAPAVDRGAHWLAVAEADYEGRRFDAANAAARIAIGHFARADIDVLARDERFVTAARDRYLSLDAMGTLGPTGRQLRAVPAED